LIRVTINLAPADLRKEGSAYDLPMAIGVLAASEQVWPAALENAMFIGELSLDGKVRHTTGILPAAAYARASKIQTLYVPAQDAPEAGLVEGIEVIPIEDLSALIAHLQGVQPIPPYHGDRTLDTDPPPYTTDFAEVRGQTSTQKCQCEVYCDEVVGGGGGEYGAGVSDLLLTEANRFDSSDACGFAAACLDAGSTPAAPPGLTVAHAVDSL
jgi:predicted ATPase with chaperone activity